jgi:trigger factor
VATSTNLDVSVEASGSLERRMTVRVPTAEIEREVDARLRKMGKTARMKGFRPGKVPPKVVRKQYGGQIRQEVLSDVIRSSFSRAISQEQLNPAGGPSIEPLGGIDGEHFSYRATFEVYPEIALKGVEGLKIETPVVEILETDVDDMIEKLRDQRSEWQPVERKAEEGDRVAVDFVGKIDNEVFEGGEGQDVKIVVGAGQVLEDFDKALRGAAAGDQRTAKVKFPKDYPAEHLAAKKAVFEITVNSVEAKVLPELNEAFFEAFGVEDGGLEALRVEVKSNMQRELDERLRAEVKSRTLDAFLKANDVKVPRALVEQEAGHLQAEAMRRMGVKDPKQAPALENFRKTATSRVTLSLLVQELVGRQGIRVDPSRVDQRIKELAAPYERPDEAEQLYRSSQDLMSQVESTVLEEQVVDFLIEHGSAKKKTATFTEFMGA